MSADVGSGVEGRVWKECGGMKSSSELSELSLSDFKSGILVVTGGCRGSNGGGCGGERCRQGEEGRC